MYRGFGIWSVAWSPDQGKEIVAGTNENTVLIYDMERGQVGFTKRGKDSQQGFVC